MTATERLFCLTRDESGDVTGSIVWRSADLDARLAEADAALAALSSIGALAALASIEHQSRLDLIRSLLESVKIEASVGIKADE